MSQLVLRSKNALASNVQSLDYVVYENRVLSDGGIIINEAATKAVFDFIFQNQLTSKEVFSATSASWGVKLSGGKPVKLYSLFDSTGDIIINIGASSAIDFNQTTHVVPTIELKASLLNSLNTLGKTGVVTNAGIFTLSFVPMLGVGTAYGSGVNFVLGELSEVSDASNTSDSLKKRYLLNQFSRSTTADLPTNWVLNGQSYGNTGLISLPAQNVTEQNALSVFADVNSLTMFKNGSQIGQDTSVTPTDFNSNLQFNIGRGRAVSSSEMKYANSLYAHIAEAWCLVNTTSDKMKVLSTRGNLY